MKESTKWGLVLQIPNLFLLLTAIAYLLINVVSWNTISIGFNFTTNEIVWIFFGVLYGLCNIASLVLLFLNK